MRIEIAQEKYARQIADIYAPFVRSTAISLETKAPDADEVVALISNVSQQYPFLVCRDSKRITGFAYAEPSGRGAFEWTVNTQIYVHQGYQRKGIGEALYTALLSMLKQLGVANVYASVAMPNLAGCALHEKLGFKKEYCAEKVAYKLGRWHDVMYYRIVLNSGIPKEKKKIAELTEQEIKLATDEGEALLCR